MKHATVSILLIQVMALYTTVVFASARRRQEWDRQHFAPAGRSEDEGHAILMLTMRTQAGYCSTAKCRDLHKEGVSYPPWTIDSLRLSWPDGRNFPPKVCPKVRLRESDLEKLPSRLRVVWPSFTSVPAETLWQQHFNRYGSCIINRTAYGVNAELDYFNQAMKLYDLIDPVEYFNGMGIKQSDSNPVPLALIKAAVGGGDLATHLHCKGKRDNSDILRKITLCFNKQHANRRTTCPSVPGTTPTCRTSSVWYFQHPNGVEPDVSEKFSREDALSGRQGFQGPYKKLRDPEPLFERAADTLSIPATLIPPELDKYLHHKKEKEKSSSSALNSIILIVLINACFVLFIPT